MWRGRCGVYEALLPKHPTATALRKAQEHVASRDAWRPTYYWAAWQLWGLAD